MINFINIFIEENGQPPAFNIFESCEQVAKRFVNFQLIKKCFEDHLFVVINWIRMMKNLHLFN